MIEGSQEEEQIVDPLKIKKLYNKSIKNLSGGELQKVSIVTCLLQKADLYALDEPSAFLDVEDRIAIAKFHSTILLGPMENQLWLLIMMYNY